MGFTRIQEARTALSSDLVRIWHARTAERQAAAGRLISAKPDPKDWTAEEHVLFMDATGDNTVLESVPHRAPRPYDGVPRILTDADLGRNALTPKTDPEIPF